MAVCEGAEQPVFTMLAIPAEPGNPATVPSATTEYEPPRWALDLALRDFLDLPLRDFLDFLVRRPPVIGPENEGIPGSPWNPL